jgi:hypothetical protein
VSGSIVANSLAGSNCAGDQISDGGYNIDSEDTCNFNPANGSIPNTDPLLGPLEDNGGHTLTHALLDGSPAIDTGDPINCPPTDQRRAPRPFDGDGDGSAICDIGSYELVRLITLYPPFQYASGVPSVTNANNIELYNFTELTDTYTLTLSSSAWETALSTESIGPLPSQDSKAFTVSVSIPVTATWYMSDTAIITAVSGTSPTLFLATSRITTQVYSPPQISISPLVLTSTQSVNQIVTLPLTISNGYGVTLTYSITQSEVVSWLSLEPVSGTVFTDSSTQVLVTLDATGLTPGVYSVNLVVESNDPASPNLISPVIMTVTPGPQIYLPIISRIPCLYFYDDFSDSASGWEEVDDEFVRSEYLNGEFRLLTKQSGYFYLFTAPTCARESYVVEVDARWVGTPANSYGLIFGVDAEFNNYYLFDVNTDYQEFRLLRREPGYWYTIVPVTFSSAIKSGNASNHLKTTRRGNQIILEVNGVVLGTWNDSNITGLTYVGIVSSPYTNYPISDARFDNYSVNTLPPVSGIVLYKQRSANTTYGSGRPEKSHILIPDANKPWTSAIYEEH